MKKRAKMKLTDNEKRDIVRLIEEGKNLPEKYRFLLFDETKQVELNWNGKSDDITSIDLPFQIIEQVDEPRTEKIKLAQGSFDFNSGRQTAGWTNKLIWGDNKYILSSLKNGPMRDEIEKEGGIKLIYIDPPFDVGADFSMNVDVGDNSYEKKPNILEQIAYRDTWGLGEDSFLSMIYERLILMRDLLADDGSIYVHCDWRLSSPLKQILDEILGKQNFQREIIWDISVLSGYKTIANNWIRGHDTILFYSKSSNLIFNKLKQEHTKEYLDGFKKIDEDGKKYMVAHNKKRYLDDVISKGKPFGDVWGDIMSFQQQPTSSEKVDYATQKPVALLNRIVKMFSNEDSTVLDPCSGSGTLGRSAIVTGRNYILFDINDEGKKIFEESLTKIPVEELSQEIQTPLTKLLQ